MAINIDQKEGDIYINKMPNEQPIRVFTMRARTAAKSNATSGSVTTITEIKANNLLLSGTNPMVAHTIAHPNTIRET